MINSSMNNNFCLFLNMNYNRGNRIYKGYLLLKQTGINMNRTHVKTLLQIFVAIVVAIVAIKAQDNDFKQENQGALEVICSNEAVCERMYPSDRERYIQKHQEECSKACWAAAEILIQQYYEHQDSVEYK